MNTAAIDKGFAAIVNDPASDLARRLAAFSGQRGKFFLCLGSTRTSDIEGISAAGVTPAMRRLTPATDAEALLLGKTITVDSIPISPRGIVSPVVLTRACLNLSQVEASVIDCGTFQQPACQADILGDGPADCLSTGAALPLETVERLFTRGIEYGDKQGRSVDHVVLAECVPGGTTTALAVLCALGVKAGGLISSSLPVCNHHERTALVEAGLAKANLSKAQISINPLKAVAAVGDPMQPFVAGFAIAAARHCPVVLAGGSQMLAVYALSALARAALASEEASHGIFVATTKWVALDPSADTIELSRRIGAPYVASCPDFKTSRHAGLQAYEDGNVKEGIGAGAAMLLANLAGQYTSAQIMAAIDQTYDELCAAS